LGETLYRFRIARDRSVRTSVSILRRDPRIAFVQPNYLYALQASAATPTTPVEGAANSPKAATPVSSPKPVQPQPPLQYSIEKLEVERAHALALGRQVSIAVIDSAVDVSNAAFSGSHIEPFNAIGSPQPPHRHGTAMVGAIAASKELTGVAPAAKILAITAFASVPGASMAEGDTWVLLRAIDIAAAQRARIVNMSFAGPPDPLLSRAIAAGQQDGMIFVAAAGNSGANSPPLYPAAYKDVIAVGATDSHDDPFSGETRGDYVAVSAPGVDVLAVAPGGFDLTTGTSIAAAQVSGVAALLLELHPTLGQAATVAALVKSAAGRGPGKREPGVAPGPIDADLALMAASSAGARLPEAAKH
jgi:subtilisin family serine protease